MNVAAERELPPLPEAVVRHLQPLPSQAGRTAVVTGANGGLGFAITRLLVAKGARVVMACRNLESAETARRLLHDEWPEAELTVEHLDLGSLDSVRDFASRLELSRIDLLYANAGIMAVARRETKDGFEAQFGINHLGHFALVGLLLARIRGAPGSRVVSTTSGAAFMGRGDLDDPMGERRYDRWRAYGQSKLANILFTQALQRRFEAAAEDSSAHAAHPGLVHTNLQEQAANDAGSVVERWFLNGVVPTLGQGPEMGALPLICAGLSPRATGGDLWGPRWRFVRGRPVVESPPAASNDVERQEKLWRLSEELTGVEYDLH